MLIAAVATLLISIAAGEVTDGTWWDSGIRFFHAARLIAALLVATLVPFLIDRRLRR